MVGFADLELGWLVSDCGRKVNNNIKYTYASAWPDSPAAEVSCILEEVLVVEFLLSTVLMRLIYLDKPSALSSGRLELCSVDILYLFFFLLPRKNYKKRSVFYPLVDFVDPARLKISARPVTEISC